MKNIFIFFLLEKIGLARWKFLIFGVPIAISLFGCQSPLVMTKKFSLQAKFIANGKEYGAETNYTCHYEDLTWISSRGADWHIREGIYQAKISGKLEDGRSFQILPIPKDWSYKFCPSGPDALQARLFVESQNSRIDSFDEDKNLSATDNIKLIDTKITITGAGLSSFVEQKEWPHLPAPTKRYFTVHAKIYENLLWKNRLDIAKLIESKKILWFEKNKSYPFSEWSDNDVKFARMRSSYFDKLAPQFYLMVENDVWIIPDSKNKAIQWERQPMPLNDEERNQRSPSQKFKRWISYRGSLIEVPINGSYYRLFYEPEYDRLIMFASEHVALF